jgi:hypothetical protein
MGADRIKSPVRSKTAAWANARELPIVDPILAAVIRNSRREIIRSFLCYDNPPVIAMSILPPMAAATAAFIGVGISIATFKNKSDSDIAPDPNAEIDDKYFRS